MRDLRRIQEIVELCLRENEATRQSDKYLYYCVTKKLDERLLDMTMRVFLLEGKALGFPEFDSVSRARRKVQAKYPELQSVARIEKMRASREKQFRKYAKE